MAVRLPNLRSVPRCHLQLATLQEKSICHICRHFQASIYRDVLWHVRYEHRAQATRAQASAPPPCAPYIDTIVLRMAVCRLFTLLEPQKTAELECSRRASCSQRKAISEMPIVAIRSAWEPSLSFVLPFLVLPCLLWHTEALLFNDPACTLIILITRFFTYDASIQLHDSLRARLA